MSEGRRIAAYAVVLLATSYAVQGYIWYAGGVDSVAFTRLAPVVMLFPGLAALIYLRISGEGWRFIDWGLGRPMYVLYGILIPMVTALVAVALLTRLGLGESLHLSVASGEVTVKRGLFVLGHGDQHWAYFAANAALTAVVLGPVNGLVTLGEEIGWRGFLQKKLVARLGLPLGVVAVGLLWAHWHTPVILMGYNFPENPILGALVLWPATLILLSYVFAWLTIGGKSVWPAVVAHGSYNAFHGGLVDGMQYEAPRWIADLLVLIIWSVVAVAAFLLTRRGQGCRRRARSGRPWS